MALALGLASAVSAHPSRGIVVAADGTVYFSDLMRIWSITPSGRAHLLRTDLGSHTHALALARDGAVWGEDTVYSPADQSYSEAIWRFTPGRGFAYEFGPTKTLSRGIGLLRDGRGCTWHADQTGRGAGAEAGRPLVHRKCPGRAIERMVGTALEDRAFRPVLVNDISGTALARDGSFFFRQGGTIRRIVPNGGVFTIANGLARENFGIALDRDGSLVVAEAAARRVVRIAPNGQRSIAAASAKPWGPTGVAVSRGALYVLEATDYQRGVDSRMRVRRFGPNRGSAVLAVVTLPPP